MSEAKQCGVATRAFCLLLYRQPRMEQHGQKPNPDLWAICKVFSPSRPDLRRTVNAGEGGLRATEGEKTQTEAAQEETSRGSQIHLRPAPSLLILSQDTSPPIKTGNHRIALHQILVRYHQKRSVSIGRWLSPHSCESIGKNNTTSCDSAQQAERR